jgi:hypothetical protein
MHTFRHTLASRGLLAGESVDEIAFLLGHRDGNVTRAVYVREVADARRRAMRRSRMVAEYESVIAAAGISPPARVIAAAGISPPAKRSAIAPADVRPLRGGRGAVGPVSAR